MLAYVHPVAAGLTVVLLIYVGSLGLRARNDRRYGRGSLTRHARLGPIIYALVLVSWVSGVLSTWLVRNDLEVAASPHFRIGGALVLALSASWVTSRWMHRTEIRGVHPWLGASAMLLAAAQVFFGLQITP